MLDFGGGGNLWGNFGTRNCDVSARVGFDRAGCTGRVRNYVTNRIS